MQRSHTRTAARLYRAFKMPARVIGLGLMLATATIVPSVVLAQQSLSPGTDSRGAPQSSQGTPLAGPQGRIPEAPVGHRQPRPQDLPPSVLRNEGGDASSGGVNADRQLNQELQICKGC